MCCSPGVLRAVGLVLMMTACGETSPGSEDATTGSEGAGESSGSSGSFAPTTGAVEEAPPTACAEATTVVGAPRSIGEAIEFINALPRPLTLECVLERLERPLAIAGTSSIVSLQPAVGKHDPRLFLFFGEDLVMSIAVGGDHGFDLLEFGEFVAPQRTIKGELEFPLGGSVLLSAPFSRVIQRGASNTKCAICHGSEQAVDDYPLAFSSNALRFRFEEEVTVADLRGEYERCDAAAQPERCARLTALFGHGPVEQAAFPETLSTIYDQ